MMDQITRKIFDYQRKKLGFLTAAGIINHSVVILTVWMTALFTDVVYSFSSTGRWSLFILCSVITVGLILVYVILPLIRLILLSSSQNFSSVAREIGNHYDDISDKLINTYQLMRQSEVNGSDQLRLAAVEKFRKMIQSTDFREKLQFKNFIFSLPVLLILFFSNLFLVFLFNDRIGLSFERIINPSSTISVLPEGKLDVLPGDTAVVLGSDLDVSVSSDYKHISSCVLKFKREDDTKFEEVLLQGANNKFFGKLSNLRNSIYYQITAKVLNKFEQIELVHSPLYKAVIRIPPLIQELNLKIDPPAYTGLETEYPEKNTGSIIAYPGSNVEFRAVANKDIEQAAIRFSDSSSIACRVKGNILTASFRILEPKQYFVQMRDTEGITNPKPIAYTISLLDDQYPTIQILDPGEDIEIAPDAAFNLRIEGADDFGLSRLTLKYQIISSMASVQDSTWTPIVLKDSFAGERSIQFNHLWDFQYFPVSFEDVLHYYVEIRDNDIIRGPKSARSQTFSVYFPTLNQMLNEFANQQDSMIDEMKELSDRNQEMKEEIEKINRELKRENTISWERKQEIENILQQHKELKEKFDEIQNQLNQALQKLDQNELISSDIMEKYQQLQEMFRDIATPELLKALEEIQNSLEKLDKKKLRSAMDSFKLDQEALKENIERTLELFQKIQKEQQYDALMQMARKIAQEQDKISQQINDDQSFTNDKEGINKKQSSQKENLSLLQQSVKDLAQNGFPDLKDVDSDMEDRNISAKMDNVMQSVSSGNQMAAQQKSMEISSDMNGLFGQMQTMRQQMAENEKNKLMDKMKQVMFDLLRLSLEEEDLKKQSRSLSRYSDKYVDIGQHQQDLSEKLRQVASSLVELSHETFFIPPEISAHISTAYSQMNESIRSLEDRNEKVAAERQNKAMMSLNESVMSLQNSLQMMAASSSATGFEFFLQQMQQMAGQQGKLNDASLNLFQGKGNQGRLSDEQMSEMARLAAEQRKIRESLEALNKQMGNRPDMPGRLGDMATEMNEVEKELKRMQLDRQTIERQQKILRRMLDAQKSVHEREYSQKRKAETGKEYSRIAPDKNQKIFDEFLQRLEMEKQKALEEGYSHDYETLIEMYYKRLSESSTANSK